MWKKFILFLLFVLIFFATLNSLGWWSFYYTTIWYDKLLHFLAGASVVIAAWWFMEILERVKAIKKKDLIFKIFASLLFLVIIGVLWEVMEHGVDKFFDLPPLQLGTKDTLWDLIFDIFGGAFTVVLFSLFRRQPGTLTPNQEVDT